MAAYERDARTRASDFDERYRLGDSASVQANISEHVASAIHRSHEVEQAVDYDEIVISRPKICGLFIGSFNDGYDTETAFMEALAIAEELGVPVVRIDETGKLFNLLENKAMTREELMSHTTNYSPEERIGFVEEMRQPASVPGQQEQPDVLYKRIEILKSEAISADEKEIATRKRCSELATAQLNVQKAYAKAA